MLFFIIYFSSIPQKSVVNLFFDIQIPPYGSHFFYHKGVPFL